jgi:hypothetical protein
MSEECLSGYGGGFETFLSDYIDGGSDDDENEDIIEIDTTKSITNKPHNFAFSIEEKKDNDKYEAEIIINNNGKKYQKILKDKNEIDEVNNYLENRLIKFMDNTSLILSDIRNEFKHDIENLENKLSITDDENLENKLSITDDGTKKFGSEISTYIREGGRDDNDDIIYLDSSDEDNDDNNDIIYLDSSDEDNDGKNGGSNKDNNSDSDEDNNSDEDNDEFKLGGSLLNIDL